jgi:hypothetical protein
MVDWLHPAQLARTAVKVGLSGVFGAYADKRELEAALHPLQEGSFYDGDYSAEAGGPFWLDYVADLGDGFDSTYSVAWLLSRPSLTLPGEDANLLPRGRLLVLGGDQVYPAASREEYQDRFRGPYEAAFPGEPQESDPNLFATPGNHDWYDGLTSFTRLFCQGRGIGRWRTRQTRSYFAVKLPHRWWLWGIDIQLESDIDRPQMEFFRRVAKQMTSECEGGPPPRLILCTGQPSWAACGAARSDHGDLREPLPALFDNLAFFEDRIVRRNGIRLMVTLSGDLHHYMRYAESERRPRDAGEDAGQSHRPEARGAVQRITSGGGGAYLFPTHHMPDAIELPESQDRVTYRRQGSFPTPHDSRRLARGVFALPVRSAHFTLFLGAVYAVFAWTLQSASKAHEIACGADQTLSLMECLKGRSLGDADEVALVFLRVLQHSPSNVVFGLLVVYGLYRFRATEDSSLGKVWGGVHGLMHVMLSFALIWLLSIANLHWLGWGLDQPRQALLFLVEMLLGGGLAGSMLFALYLWISSKNRGRHLNEVFSAQRIADYKNFLRICIRTDGTLAIHAVGVPRVPKGKEWTRSSVPGQALFDPPNQQIPCIRIDDPIESA